MGRRAQGQVPAAGCLGKTFLHKELFCFTAMKAIRAVVQHAAYETGHSGETLGKEQHTVTAEQSSTAIGPPAAQGPVPSTAGCCREGRDSCCGLSAPRLPLHTEVGGAEKHPTAFTRRPIAFTWGQSCRMSWAADEGEGKTNAASSR